MKRMTAEIAAAPDAIKEMRRRVLVMIPIVPELSSDGSKQNVGHPPSSEVQNVCSQAMTPMSAFEPSAYIANWPIAGVCCATGQGPASNRSALFCEFL